MFNSSKWLPPPESLSLQSDEVHVWRVVLDQTDELLEKLRKTLDADELQRASRFYFEKHQRAFVVGRGFLREVIARYLKSKPEILRWSYGPYGKPVLNGKHRDSPLRFNMSHSHDLALVAVTQDSQLGVDVEHVRADFASEDIARRFFSPCEVESFNALRREEQVAAFFRCWTRKEAFIKATGRGLSQPLDGFDVTLGPGVPAALLRCDEDDASRWFLGDIEIDEGYAAALAVEGKVSKIRHFCG